MLSVIRINQEEDNPSTDTRTSYMARSWQKKQKQNILGVTISDNITWNTHIEQTAAKGNKKRTLLSKEKP